MSRVINTANPGKQRARLRRTIAEVLRHFMFKEVLDEEAKDMAATLVFSLRGIAETVENTTTAWEKRNYYLKADRFRLEWEWTILAADRLHDLIRNERWDQFPEELATLAPRFADIRVLKRTRPPSTWKSRYRLLMEQEPPT